MNKLPVFKQNETKTFRFTNEQYYYLELEYNRYLIYKSLIKQIEKILNILDTTEYNSTNNNRKKYENKNILDRFVLECINHGITPQTENIIEDNLEQHLDHTLDHTLDQTLDQNLEQSLDSNYFTSKTIHSDFIDNANDINDNILLNYLFFNKIIDNEISLHNTSYYKKMIFEYNEKKIRITPDKIFAIDNVIINSNKMFFKQSQTDSNYRMNLQINKNIIVPKFANIHCSITLQNNDYFIIKYRDYIKIISINRYYKLIKNYDKPYPYDIIRMLLRYSIFDMSSQQWSIGDNLYEDISEIFNITFEMFASPLNFNMNMFCSIFYDTDHIFGSVGSFYKLNIDKFLNQNIRGVFFNPPYLPLLMNKCTNHCLNILNDMNKLKIDFTIVSFLPNWDDADYIKKFTNSKYTVAYKIVNKGNYILHEKDKGKLINGTFDLLVIFLNSMKSTWNDEKKNQVTKDIDKIIDIMKIESREAFDKKNKNKI